MSDKLREKYFDQMSEEMKENYKKQGDAYFENFDFKEGKMDMDSTGLMARHVLSYLQSGGMYEDLDEDEKMLLSKVYTDDIINKYR